MSVGSYCPCAIWTRESGIRTERGRCRGQPGPLCKDSDSESTMGVSRTWQHKRRSRILLSTLAAPTLASPVSVRLRHTTRSTMDFSQMNAAEQAHMNRVIEKKQVSRTRSPDATHGPAEPHPLCADARLHAHVLEPRRAVLHRVLQRLHVQGPVLKRSEALLPISASRSGRPAWRCETDDPTLQEQCVMNCTDKFLKHSERVGARFAEQNAGACALRLVRTCLFLTAPDSVARLQRPWVPAANRRPATYRSSHATQFALPYHALPNSLDSLACPIALLSYTCCHECKLQPHREWVHTEVCHFDTISLLGKLIGKWYTRFELSVHGIAVFQGRTSQAAVKSYPCTACAALASSACSASPTGMAGLSGWLSPGTLSAGAVAATGGSVSGSGPVASPGSVIRPGSCGGGAAACFASASSFSSHLETNLTCAA